MIITYSLTQIDPGHVTPSGWWRCLEESLMGRICICAENVFYLLAAFGHWVPYLQSVSHHKWSSWLIYWLNWTSTKQENSTELRCHRQCCTNNLVMSVKTNLFPYFWLKGIPWQRASLQNKRIVSVRQVEKYIMPADLCRSRLVHLLPAGWGHRWELQHWVDWRVSRGWMGTAGGHQPPHRCPGRRKVWQLWCLPQRIPL